MPEDSSTSVAINPAAHQVNTTNKAPQQFDLRMAGNEVGAGQQTGGGYGQTTQPPHSQNQMAGGPQQNTQQNTHQLGAGQPPEAARQDGLHKCTRARTFLPPPFLLSFLPSIPASPDPANELTNTPRSPRPRRKEIRWRPLQRPRERGEESKVER